MAKEFVDGIIAKKGPRDFIVVKLGIRAQEFADFLLKKKSFIEQNNGWINIDIYRAKNDSEKMYASFDDWLPNKVNSNDHSPDRDEGVPF